MRTDELIRALASDGKEKGASLEHSMTLALLTGTAAAAVLFFASLGVRPDIGEVLGSLRFLFKFVVTLALALTAAAFVLRQARPGSDIRSATLALALAPILLAAAVAMELAAVPASEWVPRLWGTTWGVCLVAVPILSLGPLAALLLAMRRGAPESPGLAGAGAGLLAGGVAAALYAMHCPGDSPLFIATWYTLAIGAVTLLGALIGSRTLRW